jgi:anthranilate phosphoribosyltransferase
VEFAEALERALDGESLALDDAWRLMERILGGEADGAWIAGWLVALRVKGESPEEIAGFARALHQHATRIECRVDHLVDTCGTGGDLSGSFNISTASALVSAGAGAKVAKHGNRSVSSRCGSADVLEELGVRLELPPERVALAIETIGFGFLFAPRHHAALRHAAEPRRALGVRTVFNMLGPLVNPADAPHQVVGVYDAALLPLYGEVLRSLGRRRAMVVHGEDGLDELSVCAPSLVLNVAGDRLESSRLDPAQWGLGPHPRSELAGGDGAQNAHILRRILAGEGGAPRDVVLLNAAAALQVAGLATGWEDGLERAARAIDSGRARETLQAYVEFSRGG